MVQGVGYRFYTADYARSLGITGWVRNLWNGDVEAEIEGEKENVEKMIEAMRRGPALAYVTDMEIEKEEIEKRRYSDFNIRY